jgi:Cu/Ag efflux protein CusF
MSPENPSPWHRRLRAVAAALALGALLPSWRCAPAVSRPPPRSYSVRAEILRMPGVDRRHPEMMVRHEAIDDYVDEFGFAVGMDAMEMSFPTDPPPAVQGLAVGDKISFRFAVDWEKPAIVVDQIQKLPPETELHFRPARRNAPPDAR